ncbi:MAG: MarR family transcriptional regulator [Hyphomicrobiales bacterium]|nr:MAG: MarR family transcriptional regulator [Hyphomicrobiales bacterium]
MKQQFDLQNFLPFRLNRLASEMSAGLSSVYREKFGIEITEWRVIATLAHEGETTAQAIVASTRTHKSTISRAVTKLIGMGWVERSGPSQDGREKSFKLTSLGSQRMGEILPLVRAYEREVLKALGADGDGCLKTISLLEKVIFK